MVLMNTAHAHTRQHWLGLFQMSRDNSKDRDRDRDGRKRRRSGSERAQRKNRSRSADRDRERRRNKDRDRSRSVEKEHRKGTREQRRSRSRSRERDRERHTSSAYGTGSGSGYGYGYSYSHGHADRREEDRFERRRDREEDEDNAHRKRNRKQRNGDLEREAGEVDENGGRQDGDGHERGTHNDFGNVKFDAEDLEELEAFALGAEGKNTEEDEERILDERRKRRKEKLEKLRQEETCGATVSTQAASQNRENEAMTISEPDDRSAQQEIAKAAQTVDIFSASPVVQLDAPMMLPSAIVDEHEDDHLQSNWDDHDGYYKTVVGELLDNRYRVLGAVGRGVFSTVLKCIDTNPDSRGPFGETPVAIKMIRNNDTMRKAAQKEIQLLNEIKMRDEDKMKHCVRLLHTFEHRNHTALTFEAMQMNLREVLKKFGKDVGITVSSVQVYSRQLFFALKHLADLNIVHADIKPDNILVSDDLKSVKLCDFGSAFKETDIDNDPTPYLVSRFYRAPEIILGLAYDRMVDLWSVATCLYELFTGHVMFPGSTNNHMLKLMMDVKGRFPHKVIRAHIRSYETKLALDPHFTGDLKFKQLEMDKVSGKPIVRLVNITAPTVDLQQRLLSANTSVEDRRTVAQLADLLHKCLTLDPSKRITVNEALKHPFCSAEAIAKISARNTVA